MSGIQFMLDKTNVNFITWRNFFLNTSLFISFVFILLIFFKGFNYGIDFKGGLLIELRPLIDDLDLSKLRFDLKDCNLNGIKIQSVGIGGDVMIRVEHESFLDNSQNKTLVYIQKNLSDLVEYRRIDLIGPTVSNDLKYNGIISVSLSLIAMFFYIWFRFEWQFSLCAIISLIHDIIFVLGFYSLFELELNETIIIVMLTILGYSVNDTVVIYDRIRENLYRYKLDELDKPSFLMIINTSLNETLSRTILTSSSTLLSLLVLYFFGGVIIASFSLPIMVGIIIGTYSSIFLASFLLIKLNITNVNI